MFLCLGLCVVDWLIGCVVGWVGKLVVVFEVDFEVDFFVFGIEVYVCDVLR